MTVAALVVDIYANTAKLTKDVEDVNKNLNKVTSLAGDVAKALAAAFSIAAVEQAAMKVIDYSGHLVDLEAKTGLSTTALQKLEGAFAASGISIDTATGAVLKLQKGLGGDDKSLVALTGKLGLSFDSLKKMAPEQAFFTIADAIGKIPNQNEKALASTIAFGKGGMELMSGLDGHLQETADKFESLGLIIDEKTVHAADDFGDQLTLMGKQFMAVTAAIVGPLLPALSAFGDWLLSSSNTLHDHAALVWTVAGAIGGLTVALNLAAIKAGVMAVGTGLMAVAEGGMGIATAVLTADMAAFNAVLLANPVALVTAAVAALSLGAYELYQHWSKVVDIFEYWKLRLQGVSNANAHAQVDMDRMLDTLNAQKPVIENVTGALGKNAPALLGLGDLSGEGAAKTEKLRKELEKLHAEVNKVEHGSVVGVIDVNALGHSIEVGKEEIVKFIKWEVEQYDKDAKEIADKEDRGFDLMIAARKNYDDLVRKAVLSTTDYEIAKIDEWYTDQINAFSGAADQLQEYTDQVYASAEQMLIAAQKASKDNPMIDPNAIKKTTTAWQGVANVFVALGQAAGGSLGTILGEFGKLTVTIAAAEAANKRFSSHLGVASAMFAGEGSTSAEKWGSAVETASVVASGAVAVFHSKSVLGATMAGAQAGAAFGPWGAAIGAGVGAIYGGLRKLLGGASEAEKAARSANRAYEDSIASTLTAQEKIEAGGERWKMTVIGVRDLYLSTGRTAADASDVVSRMWAAEKQGAEAVKVVQAEINKALELRNLMADSISQLSSAEDKYHFTSVANSADLYKNYQLLIGGQHDASDVLTRMHDDFQTLVTDAMKFGTTLPEQMKDPLQKLVDMGMLTDDAGNKLTDLSGIRFDGIGSSGQTAFDKIVHSVDILVAAIKQSLHIALSDTEADLLGIAHTTLPNPFADWAIDPGTLAWLNANHMTPDQWNALGGSQIQHNAPTTDPGDGVFTGGLVTDRGIQHFAMGGNVLRGAFGTDTVPAMLTPGEMVLNAGQQRAVGSLMRQGGGGNSSALHIEIKGLRADLRAQHDREALNQGIEQRKLQKMIASAVKRAAA